MLLSSVYLLALLPYALATSIIDFSAARGDNPSVLGQMNLEAARDDKVSGNTKDLFIKLGTDPHGAPALHFHRIKGDIRAEYHALSNKVAADKTYYIGYQFRLGAIEQSLMVWQFSKEYAANNANDGGANIPLSLEFKSGKLNFQYQDSYSGKRVSQWSATLKTDTVYSIGLVINTASPGWVELYWDGKQQTFSSNGKTRLPANTFPGRAEPKFGAYRGEEVEIDNYVYRIQIGTSIKDIQEAAGLGGDGAVSAPTTTLKTTTVPATKTTATTSAPTSTGLCEWEGHCLDAACATNDDCSDPWACINGKCSVDPSITCSWKGHCAGATCVSHNDCDDPWACIYGVCAMDPTA
ncbi:uncharacterized protein ACLA_016830 [Aspergillus clavatus NRRL 1]|uniref:Uncharacterized protein n=1 Tax=Aspergillus clavatus (strain ATCC 1007 / CBS 513.65 / DSM 816 / NCTC 3887 / NRRL 1 / QM 1276 / 107) TaxID=344612 RepID=A1CBW9_ASPCL|nr:uncharacterized protein ACLA_016830 [Aspergillus clavatus NRRL 1]EAW13237.1 hypothetical protein ACLA_016830 [Aspergillus clavatus NRRL 1]